MVLLTTTPAILSAISLLPADSPLRRDLPLTTNGANSEGNGSEDLASGFDLGRNDKLGEKKDQEEDLSLPTSLDMPISHKTLILLARELRASSSPSLSSRCDGNLLSSADRSANPEAITLNHLLKGAAPYYCNHGHLNPQGPLRKVSGPEKQQKEESTSITQSGESNFAYERSKARLLREREEREYESLLLGPSRQNRDELKLNQLLKLGLSSSSTSSRNVDRYDNHHSDKPDVDDISPSLVLNIFLSMILSAVAVYYVSARLSLSSILSSSTASSSASYPSVSSSILPPPSISSSQPTAISSKTTITSDTKLQGVRILLSLLTAIVVGIAETVIYAAYLRKVESARTKERRKVEKKQVETGFGTSLGPQEKFSAQKEDEGENRYGKGGDDCGDGAGAEDVEQTLIWGRGVNGGVRRRVREKWERKKEPQLERKTTD